MTLRLAGKRCLVTGGSRGLGRAIAVAFAHSGARVAITYSNNDDDADEARRLIAEATAEASGAAEAADASPRVLVFKGSVADSAHVYACVDAVLAAWGGVDVLVNNAGVTQIVPIALLDEDDWDRLMDINLKGVYLCTRAVLRTMIKQRSGAILNIGSFASERMIEAPVHYAASKSALRGFTEALARDVGRYDIAVNLLSPGLLDVGLGRMLPRHRVQEYLDQCPMDRLGTAAEVAQAAVFIVSADNPLMTGAKIVLDGGL